MSVYDNRITSSDLDAFRSDGTVQTLSIEFTGIIGAGSTQTKETAWYTLTDMDFSQVFFENNQKHSGKWRDLSKEDVTFVLETTGSTNLSAGLYSEIDAVNDRIRFIGKLFNAYINNRALETTIITFRFVAYDSTLL